MKRKEPSSNNAGVAVLISGLPGAMGNEIARCALRRGVTLAPVAMTGPGMPKECVVTEGDQTVKVRLVGSEDPKGQKAAVTEAQAQFPGLIVIDFTHPTSVNPNSQIYAETRCPFVMGTTGGDREKLMSVTEESGTYAVIAPNMCKQIVAFQATMERMAKDFPGAFSGYELDLVESHQSTKADTSGTAKAVVASFNGLGVPFSVDQIDKIREPKKQKVLGVPAGALNGHAWHTYSLTSPDGEVMFQFVHNVSGRRTYAEGVIDGVLFLAEKIKSGSAKKIFNMIDVLSEGKMD